MIPSKSKMKTMVMIKIMGLSQRKYSSTLASRKLRSILTSHLKWEIVQWVIIHFLCNYCCLGMPRNINQMQSRTFLQKSKVTRKRVVRMRKTKTRKIRTKMKRMRKTRKEESTQGTLRSQEGQLICQVPTDPKPRRMWRCSPRDPNGRIRQGLM